MRIRFILTALALIMGFSASAQSLHEEFERELKAKNSDITSIHAYSQYYSKCFLFYIEKDL